MVTRGPIVFAKVLLVQHLQIMFHFNVLDMVQIFKSMEEPMASGGTAMPCETTQHPQPGIGKITIKVL